MNMYRWLTPSEGWPKRRLLLVAGAAALVLVSLLWAPVGLAHGTEHESGQVEATPEADDSEPTLIISLDIQVAPAGTPATTTTAGSSEDAGDDLGATASDSEVPSEMTEPETRVGPAQVVAFTVVVMNDGANEVRGITIEVDYDEASFPVVRLGGDAISATGLNNGDRISWSLATLGAGDTWTANFEATARPELPPESEPFTNVAQALVAGELVAFDSGTTVLMPALTLTRTREILRGDEAIAPGTTLRHTIRLTNNLETDVFGVVVEDEQLADDFDTSEVTISDFASFDPTPTQDRAPIRWQVETLPAGASRTFSYEATLRRSLNVGAVTITNHATVLINETVLASTKDSFTLLTPLVTLSRELEDLNGGKIEPGDTLSVILTIRNDGEVPATSVVVRDNPPAEVVADITGISAPGTRIGETIDWSLQAPLIAGEQQTLRYELRLRTDITEPRNFGANASIFLRGSAAIPAALAEATYLLEPEEEEDAAGGFLSDQEFKLILLFMILGYSTALLALWLKLKKPHVGRAILTVTIIAALLILGFGGTLTENNALSIIAAIAGFVLGQSRS